MPFDEIFHGIHELLQHFGGAHQDVADALQHHQTAQDVLEHHSTVAQHFQGGEQSGDYLTSSSTIDPNQQYVVDGRTVWGSQLKEGAGGSVYDSGSFNTTDSSDAISKTDIKKA